MVDFHILHLYQFIPLNFELVHAVHSKIRHEDSAIIIRRKNGLMRVWFFLSIFIWSKLAIFFKKVDNWTWLLKPSIFSYGEESYSAARIIGTNDFITSRVDV